MATITGDKDAVRRLLELTVRELEAQARGAAPATGKARTASVGRKKTSTDAAAAAATFRPALARVKGTRAAGSARALGGRRTGKPGIDERGVKTSYAPRDREIAVFQSAMDEYLESKSIDSGTTPGKTRAARAKTTARRGAASSAASLAPFMARPRSTGAGARKKDIDAQFGILDPGWLKVVKEKVKTLLRGKHKFIAHASPRDFRFDLGEKATIAVVGDWGGGNAAAQSVAAQIADRKPDHVIHLGDVYYSGTPEEVKTRFLEYWPTPAAPGRSFALNSNHEMYSGGYGYFDLTLRKFKQPASYFSLGNAHWRFLGLDTGYDEHDLHDPQQEWLEAQLAQEPAPKTVLLSHHQLFSLYETTDTHKLKAKVQRVLDRIYGWIWGHEHLAVVYEPVDGLRAVCLGNGCFPYKLPGRKPDGVSWIDTHKSTDPYYDGGHTFAFIELDGPQARIALIDESGTVLHTEVWR